MGFRVALTLIPLVVGVAVAVALWNRQAKIEFFSAATHVLAIGAVGMALTGRFFRLGRPGILAFGVQALFGTPGMRDEEPEGSGPVPELD
jgi:hypothetical protein